MTWRQGNKIKLNVYCDDRPVCQCHTEEDAVALVTAMNWFHEAVPDISEPPKGKLRVGLSLHFRSDSLGRWSYGEEVNRVEYNFHNLLGGSVESGALEPQYIPGMVHKYVKNALLAAVAEKLYPGADTDAAELEMAREWARARRDASKILTPDWE